MKKIKVIELFAGIGSQVKALERLNIPHERTAISEIDEHAYRSYEAIHGKTLNLGDIMEIESLPDCDLITYSFPCQDLSMAGFRRGMDKDSGTRSSLLWEVGRLLNEYSDSGREPPRVLLMENVDAIINRTHIRSFNEWIGDLSELGYTSSYEILNAKDFGIPQNRKRCFMVSIQGNTKLEFPEPVPLELRLIDLLEENPPENSYLSEKAVQGLIVHRERHDERGNGFGFKLTDPDTEVASTIQGSASWRHTDTLLQVGTLDSAYIQAQRVYDSEGISPTICAEASTTTRPKILVNPKDTEKLIHVATLDQTGFEQNKRVYDPKGLGPTLTAHYGGRHEPKIIEESQDYLPIICNTEKGYLKGRPGDGCYTSAITKKRGTVQKEMIPTLKTSICKYHGLPDIGVIDNDLRVRRLTPLECWRLMGFDDSDFNKAKEVSSNTQLYRQAGNSIVVNVLEAIFKNLYIDETVHQQQSLADYYNPGVA